jgi:hypothetical protein
MRRLITVISLEFYALLLAAWQMHVGVRTDEAKYLLDIPYPHPPLGRFIFNLLDGWAYQELFWRVVLATLMIQSVWLIVDMLKDSRLTARIAGAACWLLSAAVVLQAGTVMMVVVTALQALVLVWLLLREKPVQPYLLALFWLGCLFTAYQAVLFIPLVLVLLWKANIGIRRMFLLFCVPLALLALYTLTNPLVIASMVNQVGKDAAETLLQHTIGTFRLWLLGGSIALSIIGTIGLFLRPKAGLLLSLVLVLVYVFIARYDYYALLFTSLLIGGGVLLLRRYPHTSLPLIVLMPLGLALCLWLTPMPSSSVVSQVYRAIDAEAGTGGILLVGPFGHEWQYGTSSTILRFHTLFLPSARAVICLRACEEMQHQTEWDRLLDVPVEVWVRRS